MKKQDQCTHMFRSGPLHSSFAIGGGFGLGQCPNECLPLLVVCEDHANSMAVKMAMRSLWEGNEALKKQLAAALRHTKEGK